MWFLISQILRNGVHSFIKDGMDQIFGKIVYYKLISLPSENN